MFYCCTPRTLPFLVQLVLPAKLPKILPLHVYPVLLPSWLFAIVIQLLPILILLLLLLLLTLNPLPRTGVHPALVRLQILLPILPLNLPQRLHCRHCLQLLQHTCTILPSHVLLSIPRPLAQAPAQLPHREHPQLLRSFRTVIRLERQFAGIATLQNVAFNLLQASW